MMMNSIRFKFYISNPWRCINYIGDVIDIKSDNKNVGSFKICDVEDNGCYWIKLIYIEDIFLQIYLN